MSLFSINVTLQIFKELLSSDSVRTVFSSYSSLSLTLSFSSLSSSFLFHQNRREVEEHCELISVESDSQVSHLKTSGAGRLVKPPLRAATSSTQNLKLLLAEGAAAPPSLLCDRNRLTPGGAESHQPTLIFSFPKVFFSISVHSHHCTWLLPLHPIPPSQVTSRTLSLTHI
ncbi:hypothetical protein P8452_50007 [Trifolium repens]|nr:hypothetical protein P8452_50007 [Trifolium repens]